MMLPLMRKAFIAWLLVPVPILFGAQSTYSSSKGTWTLSSTRITAIFQFTNGYFGLQSITDATTGDQWTPPAGKRSSPVHFTAGSNTFDAQTQYQLVDQYAQSIAPSGVRQYVVLQDLAGTALITVTLEVYDGQPVVRYATNYRNASGSTVYVTSANMLYWGFGDLGRSYTGFKVNQWSVDPNENFQTTQTPLNPSGTAVEVDSGAGQKHCGWLAVFDSTARGLFAGWEFDGSAKATVSDTASTGVLQFSATVNALNHPVAPQADFEVPAAFVGLFHGNFDEAGYQTQSFVDAVEAVPAPAGGTFPYVSWDSWGYQEAIDEQTLMQNANLAAALGMEVFIVDLGWARSIGDWYADDTKFPDGLKSVSDYVHSLGMKFGLQFPLAEADPASPVLLANPDWVSSNVDDYFGASSLCLSNLPAQQWLIQQGIRVIDDYGVDWILQDGTNVVQQCTKSTHTHDPADSNYSNSVNGLNVVVAAIHAARPNVLWENCENGGRMMTFNMVRNYVTSITNDASGAQDSRQAMYGATYPFPPRFADRYMPASDGLTAYATNSYLFGGPWVLMNQLAALTPAEVATLDGDIQNYKSVRASLTGGKVYHIQAPAANGTDAIQSYNSSQDAVIAVVTRAGSAGSSYTFTPEGLNPAQQYTVWFEINPAVYSMLGSQLMADGVQVALPTEYTSDVVHISRQ
jgi:alpha-galactosidase